MGGAQMVQIRQMEWGDLKTLHDISLQLRQVKEPGYFERNFAEQEAGRRVIFIASMEGADAGFCILNWEPKYWLFKKQGIPETQDLNVLPAYRKRGIGTAMIRHCEELAKARGCTVMGISVGLDGSFGPAQVLYTKLGYIPDGQGVTYDRKPVSAGEFKAVDENLCLMMAKSLK
jgi:GNAT superfamily N-acetyltransferase